MNKKPLFEDKQFKKEITPIIEEPDIDVEGYISSKVNEKLKEVEREKRLEDKEKEIKKKQKKFNDALDKYISTLEMEALEKKKKKELKLKQNSKKIIEIPVPEKEQIPIPVPEKESKPESKIELHRSKGGRKIIKLDKQLDINAKKILNW
jgi:vacuolar-type H+-ATPase subunit I/STV1